MEPGVAFTCTDCIAAVKKVIKGNKVAVFGKAHCPYSAKARMLARQKYGFSAALIDVDLNAATEDLVKDALAKVVAAYGTSHSTWPKVFVDQNFVGGYDRFSEGFEGIPPPIGF